MLHDNQRICVTDKYFVCGTNPDNNGGGVIGTSNSFNDALSLKLNAIKQNYGKVEILTYDEMMRER